MRSLALGMIVLLSACASTRAANPSDPVDMAAALGDRAQQYVGMGEVCDAQAGSGYRATIVQTVQSEQQRLGVLSDLVNRAYRGHASPGLSAHLQAQTRAHNVSAASFCSAVVSQARSDLNVRANHVLTLQGAFDGMSAIRHLERPPYIDTPHLEPTGYSAWPEGITVIPVSP